MSTQDFDRIYLFTLSDLDGRATARDRFYGLLDLNGDPKPSYTALKYFLEVTGPNLTPGDPPAAATGTQPNGLFSIGWKRPDGRKLWIFWSVNAIGTVSLPGLSTATVLSGSGSGLDVPVKSNLQLLWG